MSNRLGIFFFFPFIVSDYMSLNGLQMAALEILSLAFEIISSIFYKVPISSGLFI
jgi:hypothetical protein